MAATVLWTAGTLISLATAYMFDALSGDIVLTPIINSLIEVFSELRDVSEAQTPPPSSSWSSLFGSSASSCSCPSSVNEANIGEYWDQKWYEMWRYYMPYYNYYYDYYNLKDPFAEDDDNVTSVCSCNDGHITKITVLGAGLCLAWILAFVLMLGWLNIGIVGHMRTRLQRWLPWRYLTWLRSIASGMWGDVKVIWRAMVFFNCEVLLVLSKRMPLPACKSRLRRAALKHRPYTAAPVSSAGGFEDSQGSPSTSPLLSTPSRRSLSQLQREMATGSSRSARQGSLLQGGLSLRRMGRTRLPQTRIGYWRTTFNPHGGDGNCLFAVLSKIEGGSTPRARMRERIEEHARHLWHTNEILSGGLTLEALLKRHGVAAEDFFGQYKHRWGNTIDVYVASHLLQRNIDIVDIYTSRRVTAVRISSTNKQVVEIGYQNYHFVLGRSRKIGPCRKTTWTSTLASWLGFRTQRLEENVTTGGMRGRDHDVSSHQRIGRCLLDDTEQKYNNRRRMAIMEQRHREEEDDDDAEHGQPRPIPVDWLSGEDEYTRTWYSFDMTRIRWWLHALMPWLAGWKQHIRTPPLTMRHGGGPHTGGKGRPTLETELPNKEVVIGFTREKRVSKKQDGDLFADVKRRVEIAKAVLEDEKETELTLDEGVWGAADDLALKYSTPGVPAIFVVGSDIQTKLRERSIIVYRDADQSNLPTSFDRDTLAGACKQVSSLGCSATAVREEMQNGRIHPSYGSKASKVLDQWIKARERPRPKQGAAHQAGSQVQGKRPYPFGTARSTTNTPGATGSQSRPAGTETDKKQVDHTCNVTLVNADCVIVDNEVADNVYHNGMSEADREGEVADDPDHEIEHFRPPKSAKMNLKPFDYDIPMAVDLVVEPVLTMMEREQNGAPTHRGDGYLRFGIGRRAVSAVVGFPPRELFSIQSINLHRTMTATAWIVLEGCLMNWEFVLLHISMARQVMRELLVQTMRVVRGQAVCSYPGVFMACLAPLSHGVRVYVKPVPGIPTERIAWEISMLANKYIAAEEREHDLHKVRLCLYMTDWPEDIEQECNQLVKGGAIKAAQEGEPQAVKVSMQGLFDNDEYLALERGICFEEKDVYGSAVTGVDYQENLLSRPHELGKSSVMTSCTTRATPAPCFLLASRFASSWRVWPFALCVVAWLLWSLSPDEVCCAHFCENLCEGGGLQGRRPTVDSIIQSCSLLVKRQRWSTLAERHVLCTSPVQNVVVDSNIACLKMGTVDDCILSAIWLQRSLSVSSWHVRTLARTWMKMAAKQGYMVAGYMVQNLAEEVDLTCDEYIDRVWDPTQNLAPAFLFVTVVDILYQLGISVMSDEGVRQDGLIAHAKWQIYGSGETWLLYNVDNDRMPLLQSAAGAPISPTEFYQGAGRTKLSFLQKQVRRWRRFSPPVREMTMTSSKGTPLIVQYAGKVGSDDLLATYAKHKRIGRQYLRMKVTFRGRGRVLKYKGREWYSTNWHLMHIVMINRRYSLLASTDQSKPSKEGKTYRRLSQKDANEIEHDLLWDTMAHGSAPREDEITRAQAEEELMRELLNCQVALEDDIARDRPPATRQVQVNINGIMHVPDWWKSKDLLAFMHGWFGVGQDDVQVADDTSFVAAELNAVVKRDDEGWFLEGGGNQTRVQRDRVAASASEVLIDSLSKTRQGLTIEHKLVRYLLGTDHKAARAVFQADTDAQRCRAFGASLKRAGLPIQSAGLMKAAADLEKAARNSDVDIPATADSVPNTINYGSEAEQSDSQQRSRQASSS
eukprot:6455342-Amphidinium_carterae.1